MRFLIDNALSPKVSQALRDAGHDAVHVREVSLHQQNDSDILEYALSENQFWCPLTLTSALYLLSGNIQSLP